jgi:hypothetical protein
MIPRSYDGRPFNTPGTNWAYHDGSVYHIDKDGCAHRAEPKVSGKERKRRKKQRRRDS